MSAPFADRLQERYGSAAAPTGVLSNAVLEGLLAHRSVRAFLNQPLPEGTLETLVAAAQSAASSSNLQVWSLVAVEEPARKARLAALAGNQRHIVEAPLLLVWLADLSRVRRLGERADVELEAVPFLESLLLGTIDAALAAQNAVVALESLGLGSVYIGAIRNDIEAVAAELHLPADVYPVFGLAIGHPDPQRPAKVKPRLPQPAVLHRETYGTAPEAAAIEAYDQSLGAFYRSEGLTAANWSEQVLARLGRVAALHGREHLVEALKKRGFGLR